jgi:hypothetical protein
MTITQPVARPVVGAVARGASGPQGGGPTRGPELITTPVGTGWTPSGGTVTINANSVTFTAANSNDAAFLAVTLEDNTLYEAIWTVSAYSGGAAKARAFGPTTAHSGISAAGKTAIGTYTDQFTTNAAGTSTNRVQIQATGATGGSNSFTVTSYSLKKVLR